MSNEHLGENVLPLHVLPQLHHAVHVPPSQQLADHRLVRPKPGAAEFLLVLAALHHLKDLHRFCYLPPLPFPPAVVIHAIGGVFLDGAGVFQAKEEKEACFRWGKRFSREGGERGVIWMGGKIFK